MIPPTGKELYAGQAVPHFNEVDEGAGLDALVTNRVWTAMGLRSGHDAARYALGRTLSAVMASTILSGCS